MAARSLWGKSDYGEGECWLPLYVHLADAAGVAGRLWDCWLPKATREVVARAVGGEDGGDEALAGSYLVFLPGMYDVGKVRLLMFTKRWADFTRLNAHFRRRRMGQRCGNIGGTRSL